MWRCGIILPVSSSAAQAHAFYAEVLDRGEVWAIRDGNGYPAPEADGRRAMPFWSSRARAQRIIDTVEAFRGFQPVALTLQEWRARWIPGLLADGLLVGLNWSGARATGYDVAPDDVERNLMARRRD